MHELDVSALVTRADAPIGVEHEVEAVEPPLVLHHTQDLVL